MTLHSGQVTQLLQGVSQQHPKDRAEGQNTEQINCISDVVEGLRRRPAAQVLKEMTGLDNYFTLTDSTALYSYSRGDGTEEYMMLFDDDGYVKVYDAVTGEEKTVNPQPAGFPLYWEYFKNCDNPSEDLRFHTIGDTTFVLNTTIQPAMKASTPSAALGATALVYATRVSYGHAYRILIDGVQVALATTPSSVTITAGTEQNKQLTLSTSDIMGCLVNGTAAAGITITEYLTQAGAGLDGNGGTGWTITLKDDILYLKRTDGTEFQIAVEDGNHGTDLKTIRNSVKSFEDLPNFAPHSYKVEVSGTGDERFDNYWVKWLPSSGSTTNWAGDGVWQECIAPSTETTIDQVTMPHIITRDSTGDFTGTTPVWGTREAGDANSNPDPSFIGTEILDIGSYQNRLYLLSGENICMSRTFDHLEFFAESVAAPADDDPVDSASSDNQITDLLHSVIHSGSLVLFSNNAQFVHSKDTAVTPATFAVSADSKFNVSPTVRPVTTGTNIMFPTEFGNFTQVWEYNISTISGAPQCESITKHVPKYIVGNPVQMIANTTTDYVFLRTDDDAATVYVQQFYTKDQKRAQLAWHKWTFPNITKIMAMTLLNSRLYMVVERDSKVYFEYIDMSLPMTDDSNFELYLDHFYTEQVTSDAYTIGGVDYTARVTHQEDDIDTFIQGDGGANEGFLITDYAIDSGYVYANLAADSYVVQGFHVSSSGTLTNPYVRDADGRPYTKETIIDSVTLNVQDTGYVTFTIEHAAGANFDHTFDGQRLNDWQYLLGIASEHATDINLPVDDYRELTTIKYESNHHLGFSLMSMDWLCRMHTRGRRSR